MNESRLGLSGGIAQRFLTTEITPLLALVGLLLGVFAVLVTPREEEPQINVTFANVFIPFAGATAGEIDADALFYLRTRGIGEDEARALLIEAFLMEALEEISVPAVRDDFAARLKARLDEMGTAS